MCAQLLRRGHPVDLCDPDTGHTPLMFAAFHGHLEVTKLLLDHGADPNKFCGENKFSPLLNAIKGNYVPLIKLLLEYGADVNLSHQNSTSPLMVALYFGYKESCEVLIRSGANVNSVHKTLHMGPADNSRSIVLTQLGLHNHLTPLMEASSHGNVDMIRLLVNNGADVNLCPDGVSPLMIAVAFEHVEACNLLIECGAEVNVANQKSILFTAVERGSYNMCKLLLEQKAKVNSGDSSSGCSPLMKAVQIGRSDICSLLLKHEADVNTIRTSGTTALVTAVNQGHGELASMLMWHGADVNFAHPATGETVLMAAVVRGHQDILTNLLHHGAEVGTRVAGDTALAMAVARGREDMCRTLLQFGANARDTVTVSKSNIMNIYQHQKFINTFGRREAHEILQKFRNSFRDREPLLVIAAESGSTEICRLLLKHGADPESSTSIGLTALFIANSKEDFNTIDVLLEFGANVNAQGIEGAPPLFSAVQCGSIENVRMLLEHGADPNSKMTREHFGARTVLEECAYSGKVEVAKLLLSHGADIHIGSPLSIACDAGHLEVAKLLVENGADPHKWDQRGVALIHQAAKDNHPDVVRYLVTELGCDPNCVSREKNGEKTPLMYAALGGAKECVECLLDLGADPNICVKVSYTATMSISKTALLLALDYPDMRIIEMLCAVTTVGMYLYLCKMYVICSICFDV